MNKFQLLVNKLLSENVGGNIAGQGGALGSSSGTPSQFSGPNVWAPNENRLAQGIGGVLPAKCKKRSKKNSKKKVNPLVIRRNLQRKAL
jgi:hypothetical protein